MTYRYRCAIVDDTLKKEDEASYNLGYGIETTIFPTIKEALENFGINDAVINSKGILVPFHKLVHQYDIVLLDFHMDKEMNDHPMGALSLLPLFVETFEGRRMGRGNCVCLPYSDKIWSIYPAAATIFQVTMSAALRNKVEIFPSALTGLIERNVVEELLEHRVKSIGQALPSSCIQEAMALLYENRDAIFNRPLTRVAKHMGVKNLSLKELLPHYKSGKIVRAWILSNLGKNSLAISLALAYREFYELNDGAHPGEVMIDDNGIEVYLNSKILRSWFGKTPNGEYAIKGTRRNYPVCEEVYNEIMQLSWKDNIERASKLRTCFRLNLDNSYPDEGYTPELFNNLVSGFAFKWHPTSGYCFIHRYALRNLIISAATQLRKGVMQESRQVCHVIGINGDPNPELLFVLPQEDTINDSVAKQLSTNLISKRTWGLFPSILRWGTAYLKSPDSLHTIGPGYCLSKTGGEEPVKDVFDKLSSLGIVNAILFGIPWEPPL